MGVGKDIRDENAKKLFVQNFLVLFVTCFVEGNTVGSCNTKFLHYITSIDKVKELDWCGYTFDRLGEAAKSWREENGSYFHGSVTTLIVHYMDSKYATRKRLEWTPDKLWTEDGNLNNSEEELNRNVVEGEKKPKKQKLTTNGLNKKGVEGKKKPKKQKLTTNELNEKFAKFVSAKEELEEELELWSQQHPNDETYVELRKKMKIWNDAEATAKALLSLKDAETWSSANLRLEYTVSIGPFRISSTKAIDGREKRIIQWVYRKANNNDEWVAIINNGAAIEKRLMMEHLNLDSWLNEGIINYVSQYLCTRACESPRNLKYWYFPSYLEKETRNADFEKNIKEVSKTWVHPKETDSLGLKLRKIEQIFVPVCHGGHFKLVVVNMKTKKLEEWDTLKKTRKDEDKDLLRRVVMTTSPW
ncbi:hypothetical protein LXL04_029770 [Taraxacum kok-saghyz]